MTNDEKRAIRAEALLAQREAEQHLACLLQKANKTGELFTSLGRAISELAHANDSGAAETELVSHWQRMRAEDFTDIPSFANEVIAARKAVAQAAAKCSGLGV